MRGDNILSFNNLENLVCQSVFSVKTVGEGTHVVLPLNANISYELIIINCLLVFSNRMFAFVSVFAVFLLIKASEHSKKFTRFILTSNSSTNPKVSYYFTKSFCLCM